MTETRSGGPPPRLVGFIFGRHADYVWGLLPLFLLCVFLFTVSMAMGFHFGDAIPGETLEDLLGALPDVGNLSTTTLFLFIVANNTFKSFLWMVLGVLFAVPPLFFTILNGFLVGWFTYTVSLEIGIPLTAASLLPHGVIEVSAILLSSAAGMGLGYQLVNRLRGRSGLRAEFGRALRLYIWRIVPMLILAAIVEMLLISIPRSFTS